MAESSGKLMYSPVAAETPTGTAAGRDTRRLEMSSSW